ncbi:MAG: TonB-dependent receptor plug domain-containing protein [Gemmatimonadetes bacterium]|nr:TonB-dependent receptor plug domain-containing protein [Gemmatimonadota bacterium]MBK7348610.1 TonB-dependent receptor plug domain-containing protein [Gemmatimonadota bacterium]MBK7714175.1 TonB-dependent receptor plug domain-containing protein [Gemmatimonadota bacterium]MBK7783238.1 TonB-dependent receptor plug domain-containing protein [Gemmatimonadota bacterium]MBK7924180.1 TonB-dependent receptor plug domain-containing protein [Gemmatimonadota bacterium]
MSSLRAAGEQQPGNGKRGRGHRFPFARWALALLLLGAVAAHPVAGQIPFDSIPPDSLLRRDTVNTTERYLEAQKALQVRLPVLPLVGVGTPSTPMSRIVLSRDSIDWAMAETLGDLLQRVPGVYLWRGGWVGRTEYPDYRGRGPASVEYFVDGVAYLPIGPDSLGVDPSFFSLSMYDRVEIERWPAGLRVHLFTDRHGSKAPYSRVGISSGDRSIARYAGALEYRFGNGLGVAAAGERMVAPTATGTSSNFDITNMWLQANYLPSARLGFQAQLIRSSPDRKPFVESPDTLELRLTGERNDAQLRAFWRSRDDDLGLRVDGFVTRTGWRGGGVTDAVRQGGAVVAWRTPTFGVAGRLFNRSRWTPWEVRGEAGWTPLAHASAAAEVGYQTHDLDRTSRWVSVRGALALPLGFEAQATVRTGSIVATPTVLTDQAQSLTDWQGTLRWQRPWAGLEVGYGQTDAFRPLAFRPFTPGIPGVAAAPRTEWLTVGWRLAPRKWLTLEGWYSDPVSSAGPDGVPPTHSLTTATIRSKFLRRFKSGIFDLKAQLAFESWGDGVIGRDALGAPIALDGASFWRTEIELRLDSFLLYWERYNMQASQKTYVPRFPIGNFVSTFGVKWEFAN